MRRMILTLDTAALLCASCAAIVRVMYGPLAILRALAWAAIALFMAALVLDTGEHRQ